MGNLTRFKKGLQKWNTFIAGYTGPYDFSNSVYVGMNKKVTYKCPAHGEVTSDAKVVMRGGVCQKCAFASRKGRARVTQSQMLSRFVATHGAKYGYEKAIYRTQQTPVQILCKEHGYFWQKPEFHWSGAGCTMCFHEHKRGASQKDTLESFTTKVKNTFGTGITVLAQEYVNSQAAVDVTCNKHGGVLSTRANWLVNGSNPCPKCNHMKSKKEQDVADFLSIFTPVVSRDRTILIPKELDIYLPEHNLAIEFCGMYWHSHGDKESTRTNKNRHYEKYVKCAEKGIRLITLYETEWDKTPNAIKRLLRNSIGKTKGKLMARKCELRKVNAEEARSFYNKYHPQGGEGYGEHYGLFWKNKLVACMRFTYGINDRGRKAKNREWTLSRYATRVTVSGAASRLFKAFVMEHNPEMVKSFSDNRLFSGGMYWQLGFVLGEESPPDYSVWSMKLGLRPKPHYQRRMIPKRLQEHGFENESFDPDTDPRTESEMTYLMGARRIYDCGKKRWVWKPTNNLDAFYTNLI